MNHNCKKGEGGHGTWRDGFETNPRRLILLLLLDGIGEWVIESLIS